MSESHNGIPMESVRDVSSSIDDLKRFKETNPARTRGFFYCLRAGVSPYPTGGPGLYPLLPAPINFITTRNRDD